MISDISWLSIYDIDNVELLIFFKKRALGVENGVLQSASRIFLYTSFQILFTCSTTTKFADA